MSSVSSNYTQNRNEYADALRTERNEKEEAEAAHEREMKHLQEGYEQEKSKMVDRYEGSIQNEKLNHYDQLRKLKSQIQQEEKRLDDARKQVVSEKGTQLLHEASATEKEGLAKIDELKRKYAAAEAYEQKSIQDAQAEIRTKHHQSAEMILKDSEKKIGALEEQKQVELENQKATHSEALQQIKDHYAELRSTNADQYQEELRNDQVKTATDLANHRLQNAEWLQRYTSRQADPFYHLTRLSTELTEQPEHYVLKIKIPEHERSQLRVQVSGQELQINGIRSNNEKAEVEPGHWVSTSSFQNYSERFPLAYPADSKSLVAKNNGDYVEYTLKKYGPEHRIGDIPAHLRGQDKDVYTQLDFPSTLPKPSLAEIKAKVNSGKA